MGRQTGTTATALLRNYAKDAEDQKQQEDKRGRQEAGAGSWAPEKR